MGLFKKVAQKFIDRKVDKFVEKNIDNHPNMSAEQKAGFKQAAYVNSDLISSNFEDSAKSGGKAALAFIAGFASGGPVAAFAAGISTGAAESQRNLQKHVDRVLATGIPIQYNGQMIYPGNANEILNNNNLHGETDTIIFNAKAIGLGILAFGIAAAVIASQKEKEQ